MSRDRTRTDPTQPARPVRPRPEEVTLYDLYEQGGRTEQRIDGLTGRVGDLEVTTGELKTAVQELDVATQVRKAKRAQTWFVLKIFGLVATGGGGLIVAIWQLLK